MRGSLWELIIVTGLPVLSQAHFLSSDKLSLMWMGICERQEDIDSNVNSAQKKL